MKKLKLVIIIMAAAVIAALGIFLTANYINNKNEEEKQAEENKLIMFDFDSDEVKKVEITNQSGTYTAEYDSEKGWQLTTQDDINLNDSLIGAIASQVSGLKAEKILDSKDKAKYGLDDPIKITVYEGDIPHTVFIGNESPTAEHYYAMRDHDEQIYLISFSNGSVLSASRDALKNKFIYTYSSYDVDHFAVWKGKESDDNILFSMNKDEDGNWTMDKPYKDDSVYNTQITNFLTSTSRDEILSFVEEDCKESDYPKYGFDDPTRVFEISAGDKTTKVIFGKDTEDGTAFYGLFPLTGQVVTFEKNTVTVFNYSTLSMVNTSIFSAEMSDVSSVEVTMPDDTAKLNFATSSGNRAVNGKEVDDMGSDTVKAMEAFYDSFNNSYFTAEEDKDAEPSGDAYLTVKYALRSNVVYNIEYIPDSSDEYYYAVKDTEYAGYKVPRSTINNIIEKYKQLKDKIS